MTESSLCDCDCSCCSFGSPEVSGLQFIQLFTQQPVFHSWSVPAHRYITCNTWLIFSWSYYLIHSKGKVCWRQPGVSSSNTNLAERHRRLLWRSPKEAWEGKPATPGGWRWWRGWRKWHVKSQQKVRLNYYRCSHEFCFEKLVYLQTVSACSDFVDHCSFIWVINWIYSVFSQLAALTFWKVSIKQSFWPKFVIIHIKRIYCSCFGSGWLNT